MSCGWTKWERLASSESRDPNDLLRSLFSSENAEGTLTVIFGSSSSGLATPISYSSDLFGLTSDSSPIDPVPLSSRAEGASLITSEGSIWSGFFSLNSPEFGFEPEFVLVDPCFPGYWSTETFVSQNSSGCFFPWVVEIGVLCPSSFYSSGYGSSSSLLVQSPITLEVDYIFDRFWSKRDSCSEILGISDLRRESMMGFPFLSNSGFKSFCTLGSGSA